MTSKKWLEDNILTLVSLVILVYLIYLIISSLLGHSLDAITLGLGIVVSINLFVANQISRLNDSIKDLCKDIALGFKDISSKLNKNSKR